MSDLSLQLQQASSQLPVSSYFDEALYQREIAALFKNGPRYVGHQLAVPQVGDFYTLPQLNNGICLRQINDRVSVFKVCISTTNLTFADIKTLTSNECSFNRGKHF